MEFQDYIFIDDIEKSWNQCLNVWKKNKRIEDFPRCTRRPKYFPSFPKKLGLVFAQIFKNKFSFVIEKLYSKNKFEALCAFECLEYICWEFNYGNVPEEIFEIELDLPDVILEEIPGDADAPGFKGKKIGEFLKYKFNEEYEE